VQPQETFRVKVQRIVFLKNNLQPLIFAKLVLTEILRFEQLLARFARKPRSIIEQQASLFGMEIFVGTYMRRWLSPCEPPNHLGKNR